MAAKSSLRNMALCLTAVCAAPAACAEEDDQGAHRGCCSGRGPGFHRQGASQGGCHLRVADFRCRGNTWLLRADRCRWFGKRLCSQVRYRWFRRPSHPYGGRASGWHRVQYFGAFAFRDSRSWCQVYRREFSFPRAVEGFCRPSCRYQGWWRRGCHHRFHHHFPRIHQGYRPGRRAG